MFVNENPPLAAVVAVATTLLPRVEAQRKLSDAIRGNGKGM